MVAMLTARARVPAMACVGGPAAYPRPAGACCGAATLLLPVAGRQASLAAVAAMATLADVCPHLETERGAAAKVLSRTGSEGVRGGFREQSWKGCLRASFCRCKPNFRGLGVYVPRSVDWHPG